MTIQEACELVIQAGAIGKDGEALVLDMGQSVKIADVAGRLVTQADRPVQIVYTGLRPGEKLHEVLLASDELDDRPVHPLISHVAVPLIEPATILELDLDLNAGELTARLHTSASVQCGTWVRPTGAEITKPLLGGHPNSTEPKPKPSCSQPEREPDQRSEAVPPDVGPLRRQLRQLDEPDRATPAGTVHHPNCRNVTGAGTPAPALAGAHHDSLTCSAPSLPT